MPATHYDILGVAPDVAASELRRAYVALAQRHHPDRPGGDAERMREVNEAWATLGDPVRRRRYDLGLREPFVSRHAVRSEPFVVEADDVDLDDTPIGRTVVLPRWLALIPVGLFAASVALFFLGVLVGLAPLLGLALMTFALSTMLFFAAPFLALYASRRPNR